MSIEIQGAGRAPAPALPQATQGAASVPAPKAVAAEPAAAKVMPIPKAEINVNTERKKQDIQQAVSILNEQMRDGGRGLNFAVDKIVGGPVVTVTNQDTGEFIRQIPNEVAVQMAHSLEQLKGFLLNAKT